MKTLSLCLILFSLLCCASCSYEEKRKLETVLEQSVDKFHQQLNDDQYHDIYAQADAELQNRISEADFTAQLNEAHARLSTTSGKSNVILDESFWRGLRKSFGVRREKITHVEMTTGSDRILGIERFEWAVQDNQPKLVSYNLQELCQKPCTIVFNSK